MKIYHVLLLSLTFIISGCYTEKHIVDPLGQSNSFKMSGNSSAYITRASDGQYGNTTYQQSGNMTSMAIKSALSSHIRDIVQGRDVESFKDSLESAKQKENDYLFYPTILQWVDRATEWSGKSDKITIQIAVIDVKTGQEVSAVKIKSNSSWWTFGGDHPQDLLDKPISSYIDSLF